MLEAKPKHQRKISNFLIMPSFQLRYIFWLTASGLFLVLLNVVVIYHYFKENYTSLVELSPMTDEAKNQLFAELHHFITILSLLSLGFLIMVAILGLLFSHRTAGPLYHFNRIFEEIKKGNRKARVHLRPKDEFQEVARNFNLMMDDLQIK